jgi:GTP-binding protein
MAFDALKNTRYLISETDPLRLPSADAEIAFVGHSNVGKSSLICSLSENKKLARVSNTPGRTRAVNVFEVKKGRWIVDLPGYGEAVGRREEVDYWPKMIRRYLAGRPNMVWVGLLLDAEFGVGDEEAAMLDWLTEKKIPARIIVNKVDRLGLEKQKLARASIAESLGISPEDLVWISAKEEYGMKVFRREVAEALGA